MKILKLGKYLSVFYAGMLLSEQGHTVIKIMADNEPLLELEKGEELLAWLNYKKIIKTKNDKNIQDLINKYKPDIVLENISYLNPKYFKIAKKTKWVSIRPSGNLDKSFDIFAQIQTFGEYKKYFDFYIGDTVAGLFAAFIAMSSNKQYNVVRQAEALQKIIEGELIVKKPATGWDKKIYKIENDTAMVEYNNKLLITKSWTRDNKLKYLNHKKGRIIFN